MAIKLLENIGIENTGLGASALNNLIAGYKSGIVGKYLNECAFTATGNTVIIDKGLLIICGRQVELDAIESITLSSVPSEDVRYQIVIELKREESGEVTASIFIRQPTSLIQENLMKDGFVYQFELGRVTHKKTGQVAEVLRTADILYGQSGAGADIEVGEVTTAMVDTNIPAEVNINKVLDDGKTKLNFDFLLPKPYDENVTDLVSAVTTTGNPINIQNTNDGFIDKIKIVNNSGATINSPISGTAVNKNLCTNDVSDWEQGSVQESSAIGTTYLNTKLSSTTRIRTKELIRVKNPITFSFNDSLFDVFITLFDENQLYLGQFSGWNLTTFTEIRDCEYMAITVRKKDNSTITASDIETVFLQGEKGSTATQYEPYTETAFSIPLKDTSGNTLSLNPADVIEMVDGKYHLNSTELHDDSQDALRSIPTYHGQTNLIGNQPFTFNVTEFQLGLESIDAMLTLPDGTRVNVLTKDRMVYITSGEYKGKTLDYVLQELKNEIDSKAIKQPNKTYVLYYATAGANNLYLSAETYAHTYTVAGAYLITISGTGSLATVDWGDGTSDTVDFTGGLKINNQADKDKYIEVHLGTNCAVIGEYTFYNCSKLTSITIPNGVTSIGNWAFAYCSGLTSITIPNGVTSVGSNAFLTCTGLTSITIPNSITRISEYAFNNCGGLTSVTIGKGVTSIGYNAFLNCSRLTSITIPDSVTSIGTNAFSGCSGLTSITLPFVGKTKNGTSNTNFGHIFNGNDNVPSSLKTVIITGGTSIGEKAFENCSGLTSITIPNSVTSIGDSAFRGCNGLTSITIPDSVTSIGSFTFYDCSRLTSITIPDSVTSINSYAFRGCNGLTSVTIGNGVTSIGNHAFDDCSGLTSITIPNGVTSIGSNAFDDCRGLTSINFLGFALPTIALGAFVFCRIADIIAVNQTMADSAASAIETAGGYLLTNYRKLY